MSTRSNIGVIHADETVTMIYCHSDGYLDGVGETLLEYYTEPEKVFQLIDLGSISQLGEEIGEKHDFDSHSHSSSWCLAYGRDRGEDGTEAMTYKNKELAKKEMEEYLYLFNPSTKEWIVSDHEEPFVALTKELVESQ